MTTAAPAAQNNNNTDLKVLAEEIADLIGMNNVDAAIQKFRAASNDKQYAILMDRDALVLHTAAWKGLTDVITAMLAGLSAGKHVKAITAPDTNGNTPLHDAAWKDRAGAIIAMLKGLSPNRHLKAITAANTDGETPLHRAAQFGYADAITAMLAGLSAEKHFKAIMAAGTNGKTPLHDAAVYGRVDVITAMLARLDAAQCRDALFNEQHGVVIKFAQDYANNRHDPRAQRYLNTLIKGVDALELSENDKKGLITGIMQEVEKINPNEEIPSAAVRHLNIPTTVGGYLQGLRGSFAQAATAATAVPANGNDNTPAAGGEEKPGVGAPGNTPAPSGQ